MDETNAKLKFLYTVGSAPVPGHPELTANKMAQIWNNLILKNAKSIAFVRASAFKWYWKNPKT